MSQLLCFGKLSEQGVDVSRLLNEQNQSLPLFGPFLCQLHQPLNLMLDHLLPLLSEGRRLQDL